MSQNRGQLVAGTVFNPSWVSGYLTDTLLQRTGLNE